MVFIHTCTHKVNRGTHSVISLQARLNIEPWEIICSYDMNAYDHLQYDQLRITAYVAQHTLWS